MMMTMMTMMMMMVIVMVMVLLVVMPLSLLFGVAGTVSFRSVVVVRSAAGTCTSVNTRETYHVS